MNGCILKRSGTYYYQFYTGPGKKVRKSLKTRDMRIAKSRALEMEKEFLTAVAKGELDSLQPKKEATLDVIAEVYARFAKQREASGHRLSANTVRCNLRALFRVVAVSASNKSERVDPLIQGGAVLTTRNLDLYSSTVLEGKDGTELIRARNSVASCLRMARSVFADWALTIYKREGIILPKNILEWRKYRPVKEDHGNYRVPLEHPELVARVKTEGRKLVAQADHLAGGWILCYELALRAREASSIKWNWFVRRGDHYGLLVVNRAGENFKVKGTEREIQVHSAVYDSLRAWSESVGSSSDYCIPFETFNMRYNYVCCDLASWMRAVGFDRKHFQKCAHELRKLKGSEWYSSPELGPVVAQEWLGHKDMSTTCKYYASLDRQISPPAPEWT